MFLLLIAWSSSSSQVYGLLGLCGFVLRLSLLVFTSYWSKGCEELLTLYSLCFNKCHPLCLFVILTVWLSDALNVLNHWFRSWFHVLRS